MTEAEQELLNEVRAELDEPLHTRIVDAYIATPTVESIVASVLATLSPVADEDT